MFARSIPVILAAVCLLVLPVSAAEVDSSGVYCFGTGDFSDEELSGVCITDLPEESVGVVMLGDRIIRPGDILPARELDSMTFVPARRESDTEVTLGYLPVFSNRVGEPAQITISIRGKVNQAPIGEDFAAETYKNLPVEGQLKVKDPEGEAMTFTLVRSPKRGTVEIREDGTFLYTPRKNKVGIDSFVYTATDASGKVSREATVTITIVKPTDSTQYTDTVGLECRFAAEWMKNTGIFVGEKLDGNACFYPDQPVSRGQFIAMLVRTLDIPTENADAACVAQAPKWLRPYLAAAIRSGLITGMEPEGDYDAPITGSEASAMIRWALDLDTAEVFSPEDATLTRADAALLLYQTAQLAREAPGMVVIARQR